MNTRLLRVGALTAGVALAMSGMAAASSQLPPLHKTGNVSYMSGGIGSQEATAMKAAEKGYNLALEFAKQAKPKNEYLADISVMVKNNSGKTLLDTHSQGPFLLVDMPAGKYTIVADYQGHKLTRTAAVRAQHHERLVFVWPENTGRM